MFGRKPPLPHCDHLTNGQLAKVHKLLKESTHIFVWSAVEKLLKKGEHDTVLAFARQENARKKSIDMVMLALLHTSEWSPKNAHLALDILPALSRHGADFQGSYLAAYFRNIVFDRDGCQHAIEAINDPRAFGYAAVNIIDDHMTDKRVQIFELLLDSGADLYVDKCALIKKLLHGQHYKMVDSVISRGFDLPLYADELVKYVTEEDVPHAARVYLDGVLRDKAGWTAKTMALPAPIAADGEYLRSGDIISRIDHIAGGGTLTTVFNFALAQQIVVQHTPHATQPTAPTVVDFNVIAGSEALRTAAAVFERLGGDKALIDRALASPRRIISHKREGQ